MTGLNRWRRRSGFATGVIRRPVTVVAILIAGLVLCAAASLAASPTPPAMPAIEPAQRQVLLRKWQDHILTEARARYCDTAMGEESGWLVSPFLLGFLYGYLATGDSTWMDRFIDWTNAWLRHAVVEPDGYLGWPKLGASGTDIDNLDRLYADSLLGEAMVLRPVVQAAAVILRNPALASRHTGEAREYLRIARAVLPNGISVVLGVAPTMA